LDLNLPGAYGFCALAHLRGSHPQLPVVVVSAMDDQRTVRQALALGAQGFVSKSAGADTIGRNIESVLRGEYVSPTGLGAHTESEADVVTLDLAHRLAGLTLHEFAWIDAIDIGKACVRHSSHYSARVFPTARTARAGERSPIRARYLQTCEQKITVNFAFRAGSSEHNPKSSKGRRIQ